MSRPLLAQIGVVIDLAPRDTVAVVSPSRSAASVESSRGRRCARRGLPGWVCTSTICATRRTASREREIAQVLSKKILAERPADDLAREWHDGDGDVGDSA
jgi:hypothetical protein